MHTCIPAHWRKCVYNTSHSDATEQDKNNVWPSEKMESEVWNVKKPSV